MRSQGAWLLKLWLLLFLSPLQRLCVYETKQTARAAPVSSLAREIGLPSWLVDIRHEAAHKQVGGCILEGRWPTMLFFFYFLNDLLHLYLIQVCR